LIEQILIPLKKRYAKSMGRNNIRWKNYYYWFYY
jgi:hypothetical protein